MHIRDLLTETSLKLNFGHPDNLMKFFKDFRSGTVPHPWHPRMAIWNESVGIELSAFAGHAHLSSIISFMHKNVGEASRALKWLCALANKHGVTIDLDVKPLKNAGAAQGKNLNKAQLIAWYKRNGFVSKGGDSMERLPQALTH